MAAVGGERRFRRRPEPHVVVEIGRHGHFLRRTAPPAVGADHLDRVYLADPPAADQFATAPAMARAPLHRAVLEDPLVVRKHLAAGQVRFDRQAQRFLHVSVFLRAGGHVGDRHVPVILRSHHHGVDVLAGQQVAEIGVCLALAHRCAGLAAVLIGIGHGHALDPWQPWNWKNRKLPWPPTPIWPSVTRSLAGGVVALPKAVLVMT